MKPRAKSTFDLDSIYQVVASASCTGRMRSHNEDYVLTIPRLETAPQLGLFILADGIGGLAHGAMAAQSACETIATEIMKRATSFEAAKGNWSRLLHEAIERANAEVRELGAEHGRMGCAMVVALRDRSTRSLFLSHFGDCRAYQFRPYRGITRLTSDDNFKERFAHYKPADCTSRDETALLRWIGMERLDPEVVWMRLNPDEHPNFCLLTTDGIHGAFSALTTEANLKSLSYQFRDATRKNIYVASIVDEFISEQTCSDDSSIIAFAL